MVEIAKERQGRDAGAFMIEKKSTISLPTIIIHTLIK